MKKDSLLSLKGRSLLLARIVWLILVTTTAGTFLAGVILNAARLQEACTRPPEICNQRPVQLTAEDFVLLEAEGLSPTGYAVMETIKLFLFSAIWFAVGGVLFIRKSDEPMVLLTSFFLVIFATGFDNARNLTSEIYPVWSVPSNLLSYFATVSLPFFLAVFPNGKFFPRWTLGLVVFAGLMQVPAVFVPDLPILESPGYLGVQMALLSALLYAQILRYRDKSNMKERLQTRWVLFGLSIAVGCNVIFVILYWVGILPVGPYQPSMSSFLFELVYQFTVAVVPITVGISILRYRLFEIEVIIRRTLQYALMTALLGLIYFGTVVLLQHIFENITGEQNSPIVTVISTLGIAALFNPLRIRTQDWIDRRFYREKYNAEAALAEFSRSARDEMNLDQLAESLMRVVQTTVRPERTSLWIEAGRRR